MEESQLHRIIESEKRDSEYFMWQSEDIDYDDPLESSDFRNSIYNFNSHPSILIDNKGYTKRGDLENLRS